MSSAERRACLVVRLAERRACLVVHAALVLAAFAMTIVTLGACGSSEVPRATAATASTGSPPGASAPASPTPAPSDSGSSAPSSQAAGSAGASAGPPVVSEPDLLAVIPVASRVGIEVTYDPDTTARVGADPGLAKDAAGLAIALVRVSGASADSGDVAVVSIVRLRDPKVDDAWFRAWRDSYDEAACAQAGGVVRHAEATIGGHTVFVGSCAGGAFTYHVRVRQGTIVVSVTSVGTARLGETVVARLEP